MPAQLSFPFDPAAGFGLQVLGSSSAGNATLVWSGSEAILVDCGFPMRALQRRLRSAPLPLSSVRAVLLTHTHADHAVNETIASLAALGVPVICPSGVLSALRTTHPAALIAERRGLLRPLSDLRGQAGPFAVEAVPVPHDAAGGCFGYILSTARGKITIATDLAETGDGLAAKFANSDVILIESNHDRAMLENSTRPPWLKRRIRERGHLSNEACARFVVQVVERSSSPPQAVFLAHISKECNIPALALRCTSDALTERGWGSIRVLETFRDRPSAPLEIS